MNPETIDLIKNVIEELIAAIPQIVVVLTTVVYSLNAIKAKVNTFPKITEQNQQKNIAEMTETRNKVLSMLEENKSKVESMLEENKNKVESMLEQSGLQIRTLFSAFAEENHQKVGHTLEIMEKELTTYKAKIDQNASQTNLLAQQNKLFMDIILEIIAKDPKKVSEGISQAVSTKVNLTKEQLEKYPEVLIKDIKVLESALKETYSVIGKDAFNELLERIGYGKTN
jgi:hypothetical protein